MHIGRLLFIISTFVAASALIACQPDDAANDSPNQDAETSDADTSDSALDGDDADSEDAPDTRDVDDEGGHDPDVCDPSNSSCHYDCATKYACEDGVVYEYANANIPCCVGGPELCEERREAYQCQDGCFVDSIGWLERSFVDAPEGLCNEARPRVVGDSCDADDDCAPGETYRADGEEQTKALTCDPDTNTCVDEVAPDYLEYCDSSATFEAVGGYLEAPQDGFAGCDGATFCVAEDRGDTICQSCTLECTDDADCPSGSACRSFASLEDEQAENTQLCMPVEGWDYAENFVECRAKQ